MVLRQRWMHKLATSHICLASPLPKYDDGEDEDDERR